MSHLAGPAQQRARPTADVEDGVRRHHERQVEAEVASFLPRVEHVIQLGETGLGEQAINHNPSVADRRGPPARGPKECRTPRSKTSIVRPTGVAPREPTSDYGRACGRAPR